jgi:phosphoribosylformimino-5-aminoimidazole carboxamide ribotide isomerase
VLIPSIDLMGGRVVQLQQGERLMFQTDDVDAWIRRFASYSLVQVIDLDAAKGEGENDTLVRRICAALPCQVGGGIRTPERARAIVDAGARRVIIGSALFASSRVDGDRAREFADAVDRQRVVAAIDARGPHVVTHGWRVTLSISPEDAAIALTPYCDAFLYTNVDTEGLLGGLPLDRIRSLQQATPRRLIAAGGIKSLDEVARLEAMGVDAVVGMAIYTGVIPIDSA